MNAPQNSRDQLILVNECDEVVGYANKLAAHEGTGQLHRAFSIFIFNDRGQMLLQRRAAGKYHFALLWSNACCSHPLRGQELLEAAQGRLHHEFGFQTPLEWDSSFVYRAVDEVSGLTEHEFDHVFRGQWNGQPRPHPEEIAEWKWMDIPSLRADLERHPERYTPWFKIVLEQMLHAPVA